MPRLTTVLTWVERSLIVAGLIGAGWCVKVLVVATYSQFLPIPEQFVTVRSRLPGDEPGRATAGPTRAPGSVLARLQAPSLKLSTVVLEGTDDGTLARGAGHIEDTPLPGQPGNMGIAGHRDTVFRALRRTKIGDELDVTTAHGRYRYRVTHTLIVKPEDVYVLDPTAIPSLTLVTCWPFEFIGHAPKRFIVKAELIGEQVQGVQEVQGVR